MNKVRTGKKARRSWQRKQFILISKGKPKKIIMLIQAYKVAEQTISVKSLSGR